MLRFVKALVLASVTASPLVGGVIINGNRSGCVQARFSTGPTYPATTSELVDLCGHSKYERGPGHYQKLLVGDLLLLADGMVYEVERGTLPGETRTLKKIVKGGAENAVEMDDGKIRGALVVPTKDFPNLKEMIMNGAIATAAPAEKPAVAEEIAMELNKPGTAAKDDHKAEEAPQPRIAG